MTGHETYVIEYGTGKHAAGLRSACKCSFVSGWCITIKTADRLHSEHVARMLIAAGRQA